MKQQKLRKQSSTKRFLAMMTAFAMMLSLVLEAMPLSAKAASAQGNVREVDNFTDLYYALGLSGNYEIKLTKNIEERWSDKLTKAYVFEVHGEKILNLNGHDIIMHDEYRSVGIGDSMIHTMFNVFQDGSLIIYDGTSNKTEKQGKVFYDGYMYFDDDAIPVIRNLFKVSGTLIINGGRYQAGRSKEVWTDGGHDEHDEHVNPCYAYALVYGGAVTVSEGGTFVMNGGYFDTYLGKWRDDDVNAIRVYEGGSAVINNGVVEGVGVGKLVSLRGENMAEAKVIRAGTFITGDSFLERRYKFTFNTAVFFHHPATPLGFTSANLVDNSYPFYGSFDEEGSDLLIVPGKRSSALTVEGAEAITSEKTGETYYMMKDLNAVVRVSGVTPYFTEGLTGPGLDYHSKLVWTLINAETKEILDEIETSFNQSEIRMYDFVDYTSEYRAGELYYVECKAVEQLGDAKAEIQSNRVQVATQRADYTVGGGVALTKTNFPDQNFRNYLKQFDLNGNDFLSSVEITGITKLNLIGSADWQVSDLTGLKYLWNVRTIWASENGNLSSFDGRNLPYLTELDLEGCPISSINLQDNHYLRYLNLDRSYNGNMTSLDISNCPLLTELHMYRSAVSSLDVSKNPYLVEAVLYGTEKTTGGANSYGYTTIELNEEGLYRCLTYPNIFDDDHNLYVARLADAVPDANLRSAFTSQVDVNKDGLLSSWDVKHVDTLLCDGYGIKNLKGIELLPNLERLDAYDNEITSADFSRNLKLKEISIYANQLESLDVSMLTELTVLAVGDNSIKELGVTQNKKLEFLGAQDCGLESVNVEELTELTSLSLSNNSLTSLNLDGCTKLSSLVIDRNQLRSLNVSGNTALTDLRVQNNQLNSLSLSNNKDLGYLACYGNPGLTSVDVSRSATLSGIYQGNTYSSRKDSDTGETYRAYRQAGKPDASVWDRLCVSENQYVYAGDAVLRIIEQPQTTTVYDGETAKFTISAMGNGITYQWYVKDAGQSGAQFVKTECSSAVFTIVADQSSHPYGMYVKCIVSDKDKEGNTRTRESSTAGLVIKTPPIKIVAQPQDYVGSIGSTAEFSIETQLTTGTAARYEWLYRNQEGGLMRFTDESASTPFLSTTMTEELVGCTVFCRVWDGNEYRVNSEEASFIAETVRVSFDANGGTGSMDYVTVMKGANYTLPECGFTSANGKPFVGWTLLSDEGTTLQTGLQPGTSITLDEYVICKAMWKDTSITLNFKHNIEFDNNIAMHYIVPQSELQGYLNLKLVIDKEVYAEGVATPTIQQFVLENPAPYKVNGVDYWHFTFPGISASEMGNELSAKIVCEKDGETYESQADVYTVKDYAYARLAKTSSASYKKVLVDMLNYGAAAQEHFKKNAGKPVNADLTDEQKAFGTSLEDFSVSSVEKVISLNGATAAFDAKNLVFGSNVELVYRMDFSNFKTDAPEGTTEDQKMANVKVVFKYNNGKGEKTVTVPYSKFTKNSGKYVASCSVLTPAEMGCTVNATIYDGDVPVSDTLQYSIESYVYNRLSGTGSSSETFKELLKRMVLYGRAVNEHF